MRFTLTTATVVAALALSPGTALANTDPPGLIDALDHARTMRSLALLRQHLDEQAAKNARPVRTLAPATVRLVRADDGFDWVDGALGAGVTAALVAAAAGAATARHRSSTTAH
jgi:hypothetical protein